MPTPPTVLIADDEPSMRAVLAMCCRKAGFETTMAKDGAVALARAKSNSYHLVMTDYRMPKMNGLELCRKLRSQDLHAETPIILFSAVLSNLDCESIRKEVGPIILLPKPLDLIVLPDLIQTFAAEPLSAA